MGSQNRTQLIDYNNKVPYVQLNHFAIHLKLTALLVNCISIKFLKKNPDINVSAHILLVFETLLSLDLKTESHCRG